MAMKRKSTSENADSDGKQATKDVKKKKTSPDTEVSDKFTEIDFKVMLRDPVEMVAGLKRFVKEADSWPEETDYDIVLGFIKSSPDFSEIFSILETGKRSISELFVIAQCLEKCLLRLSDLGEYKSTGLVVVNKILDKHMWQLNFMMSMKNKSSQIKSAIKLLTSMVVLSPAAARAVLQNLQFDKNQFQSLFIRRDTKDEEDVRTCLLHLVVAFLVSGDKDVIKQLLEGKSNQNFVSYVFPGLLHDRVGTVQLVLATFLEKVLMNPSVGKTTKVRVFTEKALRELAQLYRWQGLAQWKQQGKKEKQHIEIDLSEETSEGRQLVSQSVHKLLEVLCGTFRHGIVFRDKMFGVGPKNQNTIMCMFLTVLSGMAENPYVQELIIKILSTLPEQLQHFMPNLLKSLIPRPAEKWVLSMTFLNQIYSSLPMDPPVLQSRDKLPVGKLVEALIVSTMPSSQILNTVVPHRGSKVAVLTVWHKVLELLATLCHRATHILSLLSKPSAASQHFCGRYSADDLDEIIDLYRENVLKNLPQPVEIFTCIDLLQQQMTDQAANLKGIHELFDLCTAGPQQHIVAIEKVLCLYQDLNPALLQENRVGLGKLIDTVITMVNDAVKDEPSKSDTVTMETTGMTQLYLLKLLAGTDSRGSSLLQENHGGKTLIQQLLGLVTQVKPGSTLEDVSQQLICRLFESTGCFETFSEDLQIWVRCLQQAVHTTDSFSTGLLTFISQVFMNYINNSYLYMEKLGDILSSKPTESAQTEYQSAQFDIADILAAEDLGNLEEEEEEEDVSNTGSTQLENKKRFPFCPILITAMKSLQKLEPAEKGIQTFISAVVMEMLHRQTDPQPLCVYISGCPENLLLPGIQEYAMSFLSGKTVTMKILKSLETSNVSSKAQFSILQMCCAGRDTSEILDMIVTMTTDDLDLLMKQCLLFVKSSVDHATKKTKDEVADQTQKLLQVLQAALKHLMEQTPMDSNDGTTSDIISMEISLLGVHTPSSSEILTSRFKDILEHPAIKDTFLGHFVDGRRDYLTNTYIMISKFVCKVVEMLDSVQVRLEGCLSLYKKQVLSCLQSKLDGRQEALEGHSLVYTLLSSLLPQMDEKELTQSLEYLVRGQEEEDTGSVVSRWSLLKDIVSQVLVKHKESHLPLKLSQQCVQYLLNLTVKCSQSEKDLVDLVENVFMDFPYLALLCTDSEMKHLLKKFNSSSCKLIQILISHSHSARCYFGRWMTTRDKFGNNRLKYLPLVTEYLQGMSATDSDPVLQFVKTTYKADFKCVCTDADDIADHTDLVVKVIEHLHRLGVLDKKLIHKLEHKVTSSISKTGKVKGHQVKVIQVILGCLAPADNLTEDQPRRDALLKACIQGLVHSLSKKSDRNLELEKNVLNLLTDFSQSEIEYLKVSWDSLTDIWPGFVKRSLKYLYTESRLLKFLSVIVPVVYPDTNVSLTVDTLVAMVMSHSSFLPIMLSDNHNEAKDWLIELLLQLMMLAPQCCEKSHIEILLASYGATLSQTDQKTLKLLQVYEKNGVKFSAQRPLLWGSAAVSHRDNKGHSETNALKLPKMDKVLSSLDKDRLVKSLKLFPLTRRLQLDKVQTAADCKSTEDCYDPCFMLPFFSQVLSPDVVVDCRLFIERDCLGYTLCALSSHEQGIRNAAYHILDRFKVHLDTAKFQEQSQVLYVMELLRNSLPSPTSKLASIITQFLARAAKLMIHADDPMYNVINSFLLLKPSLDVHDVPEFYKLFNSHTMEYKMEREWILTLMVDGLRDVADYRIFEKRYVFKLFPSFYDSETSNHDTRILVLKLLKAASMDRTVVMDLCDNHGFLTWIPALLAKLTPDNLDQLSLISEILNRTWFTLLGNKDLMKGQVQGENSEVKIFYVNPVITGQILALLQTFVYYLREFKGPQYLTFLKTLASVLNHVDFTRTALEAKGMSYVFPVLSQADVTVVLLHAGRFLKSGVTENALLGSLTRLGQDTKLLVQGKRGRGGDFHQRRQKRQTNTRENALTQPETNESEVTLEQPSRLTSAISPSSGSKEKKESILEDRLLVDVLVNILTHWKPKETHLSPTQSNHTLTVCAGVLEVCQWVVSQTQHIHSINTLAVMSKWMEANICGQCAFSKLSAQCIAKSRDTLQPVRDGLIQLCSLATSLKTSRRPELNQYQQVLASLNSVLLVVAESQSADDITSWTDFIESEGVTSFTEICSEEQSMLLRKYFMQTTPVSQSNASRSRKRMADQSTVDTPSSKQKKLDTVDSCKKKSSTSNLKESRPTGVMDITQSPDSSTSQKENKKLPNGTSTPAGGKKRGRKPANAVTPDGVTPAKKQKSKKSLG